MLGIVVFKVTRAITRH